MSEENAHKPEEKTMLGRGTKIIKVSYYSRKSRRNKTEVIILSLWKEKSNEKFKI